MKPIDVYNEKVRTIKFLPDEDELKEEKDKFKVGDHIRALKKKKTFDKKGLVSTYTLKQHKIIDKIGNKCKLENGKMYFLENLILSNINDFEEYRKLVKQNEKANKIDSGNQKEFGTKDISQFMVQGKRVKKPKKIVDV